MEIPVIGIGAGPATDGQVLVFHDLLGIREGLGARFVKRYADLLDEMAAGVAAVRRRRARARATRRPSTATRSTPEELRALRSELAVARPRRLRRLPDGEDVPAFAAGTSPFTRFHATLARAMARLSQRLRPQGPRVLRPLRGGRRRTSCAAPTCSTRCSRTTPSSADLARDILICEQEGDRITHDIIQRLNQTFVTPIDREDILALASALDDIVDLTEEVADYLGLYKIEAPMEQAQRLAHILLAGHAARSPRRCRACASFQRHLALHGRDPPARERRRPHRAATRSPRCSTAASTRWS